MLEIDFILEQLTLEEKAGICSGGGFWHTKAVERLGIPSLITADGPHGLRKQTAGNDHLGIGISLKTTCFPTGSALASSFDRALAAELGSALADICLAEGVDILLGPGINIKRSPLCGRNFEYFSEDPYHAGEMAGAYIAAIEGKGIYAAVKHFAANNQETSRMTVSSEVDERTLFEIYFPAFEKAVESGVSVIMTSYNKINGVYSSQNDWLINGVLRKLWGFDGITVTDWSAVNDRVKALLAGQDIEMPCSGGETDAQIAKAVLGGSLPVAVLDKTVTRILKLIQKAIETRKKPKPVQINYHPLAKKIAAESAVLLKNEGLLPLKKGGKYVCAGEFAVCPRYQGSGSSRVNSEKADIPLEELRRFAGFEYLQAAADTDAYIAEAAAAAAGADGAVIFAGAADETEGKDRKDINLPAGQNRLIEAVCKAQPDTVVVLMTGSAVAMPWNWLPAAIINFHLGGEAVGSAVADILFGVSNPCGKLCETYPVRTEDTPCYLEYPGNGREAYYREGIFVGYRYYDSKKLTPLYPFGHGLSYTSFGYGDIRLDKKSLNCGEILTVKIAIKNTGAVPGKEAVQLYVRELCPEVVRPEKELKGFVKLSLAPGEEKDAEFILDYRAFAYYNGKIHDWAVREGQFEILIGASSRDIRQRVQVKVNNAGKGRREIEMSTTIGELLDCGEEPLLARVKAALGEIAEDFKQKNKKSAANGSSFDFVKLFYDMPLRGLVPLTQGKISLAQLEQIIESINLNNSVPEAKTC